MSGADQGGAGRREVAYRLFAAEYDDADFSYSESDEERAPNYVVTPTGARVNRLFAVGVLTEVEQVNEEVLRARVVDPTGAFVVYAGQYQPDEMAFLERAQPPTFVSVTGKARTFQPEDSETVYTSVRPESINEVDAETRDRWTVTTAERTLDRIATTARALAREERGDELRAALEADGVDEGLAAGIPMALEHYGTTPSYLQALRDVALDAARVVADERDEVRPLTADPAATGDATLSDLTDLDAVEGSTTTTEATTETVEAETPTAETTASAGADDAADTGTSTASPDQPTTEETATTDTEPDEARTAADEPATGTATADATAESTTTTGTAESETTPTELASTESSEPAEAAASGDTTESATTADTTSVDAGATDSATAETASDSTADDATEDEDIGDFEPGEFEIEDDERERIEDEFGTDFSTGTEVDDPGEADIETPDPEETAAAESETEVDTEPTADTDSETDETAATPDTESAAESTDDAEPVESETADTEDDAADEPAEDVDVSAAVMDVMRDLDDGDGADRETLVETVVDDYGADPDAVEDAIQDALMGGQCYEPGDSTLKPI